MRILCILAGLVAVGATSAWAAGEDAVRPLELVLEEPTLVCLAVRWYVEGDADGDASVRVSYRRRGDPGWRPALPLFRVGRSPQGHQGEDRLQAEGGAREWPFEVGNLFAGSVFDLEAGTAYELRLELSDPDGGGATETLEASTRAEPASPPAERVLHVVPGDGGGKGTPADPIRGLAAAAAVVRPGDLVLVHAGVYRGAFTTETSGEAGRPIVWRGAGDGEAVIDAGGAERGISATDIHDVFFENLAVRNAHFGMVAHRSSDIVVRRCHFYGNDYGFTATNNRPVIRRLYIADNLFEGPSTWPRTKGIESARAIQVCGEGHVVCRNRIRGFGDGIDIMHDTPNRAIDFYENDISECTDDAVEMDYGQTNVRCFRNRITNCFEGVSTQPLYGGPCYVIRNAMYNLEYTPFKMHNNSHGALYLHNTVVKTGIPWPLYTSETVQNCVSRNNLFVGGEAAYAMEFSPSMVDCDFDYDGFAGGPFAQFAKWNGRRYASLDELQREGPIERHAVLLGSGSPFASATAVPRDLKVQFPVDVNDLRLSPAAAAVDAGAVLPNVNDGYRGRAPDLGAYQLGEPLPHYGPAPAG